MKTPSYNDMFAATTMFIESHKGTLGKITPNLKFNAFAASFCRFTWLTLRWRDKSSSELKWLRAKSWHYDNMENNALGDATTTAALRSGLAAKGAAIPEWVGVLDLANSGKLHVTFRGFVRSWLEATRRSLGRQTATDVATGAFAFLTFTRNKDAKRVKDWIARHEGDAGVMGATSSAEFKVALAARGEEVPAWSSILDDANQ